VTVYTSGRTREHNGEAQHPVSVRQAEKCAFDDTIEENRLLNTDYSSDYHIRDGLW